MELYVILVLAVAVILMLASLYCLYKAKSISDANSMKDVIDQLKSTKFGYPPSKTGDKYPIACPCGCGLHWASDMPTPPHYTEPKEGKWVDQIFVPSGTK